jgi:hypothetical protein
MWVERGPDDTRVRIAQVRALQYALRLAANEGGWRVAVIADAEWLNQESQNGLLHLLEEPPKQTCVLLVASSPAGLLATIRSRCVRIPFPAEATRELRGAGADEEVAALAQRFDAIGQLAEPELLDWAEEYRGPRAIAAARVQALLEVASEWLRERVLDDVAQGRGGATVRRELDAFTHISHCRRDLVQRNANPQMIAERSLFAVQEALLR